MARDVIMPALGMAQESGVLIRWLVAEGATVTEGDPLMEVETDKAVVEVPATASGTLAAVAYGDGAELAVGTVLAVLLAPGEVLGSAGAGPAAAITAAEATDAELARPMGDAVMAEPTAGPAAVTRSPTSPAQAPARAGSSGRVGGGVLASPKAKRLARERGLDLSQVLGTGPDGAVRSVDLSSAARTRVSPGEDASSGAWPPAPAEFVDRRDAAWLRATVDAAGLSEFMQRVPVDTADVLTRVVVAGLSRDPVLATHDLLVQLSVHGPAGDAVRTLLRGQQLGSMLGVAAARAAGAPRAEEATSTMDAPRAHRGSVTADSVLAPELAPRLRVEIVDRSAEPFERSPTPLGGAAVIRLTLGPVSEVPPVRTGAPGVHQTATVQLDYRAAILDEARAAALITYVSRLLGDPFSLAVQG